MWLRWFWDYLFVEVGWLFEAHNLRAQTGTSFQTATLTDRNQSFEPTLRAFRLRRSR
ncbi:MAG: hypothetical protein R3B54_08240 [Bdellovibrionota bacterium]